VTLLRGRRQGLEVVLAGRQLDEALDELEARLAERPGFYRGTPAVARFGQTLPEAGALARLHAMLAAAGIELRAISGPAQAQALASQLGVAFEPAAGDERELDRRRALRPRGEIQLSDSARSLVADFAGARSDIAQRRRRGEASVPRLEPPTPDVSAAELQPAPPSLHVVESPPSTLYHAGTLRGGQALHHPGNIVVVGDVNPGAELVATGDVLVFGRLAGVAHAGAQGDRAARVYALDLDATQLRIATFIAADGDRSKHVARPEAALIREGHIIVVSIDRLGQLELGAVQP
jgi:septum site-determining protein MinC